MKKKTYGLMIVCMLVAMVFGIVGCSGHKHTLHLVEQKDSTCVETGYEAYYSCDCGLKFSDEAGKHRIDEPVAIPLKAHTLTEVEARAATCTESGLLHHWKCSVCKKTFEDADGQVEAKDVVEYALGHNVICYPEVLPTTKTAGMKAHYVCQNCGGFFLDKSCSEPTTEEALPIPQVEENLDGTLSTSFYPAQRAVYLGGSDLRQGGVGVIVNARTGESGVYLHMVLNHQLEHVAKDGNVLSFLRFYLTAHNKQNNAYTGRGIGENGKDVKIEFCLNGMTDGDALYFAQYHKTIENPTGKKTAYTSVWEVFIPYEELAAANHGALSEAFENNNGVYALKNGYKLYSTVVGCMFVNSDWKAETFTSTNIAGCDSKDDGWWNFWFIKGYGDWARDQKMMELSKGGLVYSSSNANNSNGNARPVAPANGLTLDGEGKATGTDYYKEAKPEQDETVINSKYAIVETTLKYNGEVGLWSHRFGILMTEKKGIGATVLPSDAGNPRLQVFPLYGEDPDDIFAGWSDKYNQHYKAVRSALNGKGLPLRMVRSDTMIYLYAKLNETWVQFGDPVFCDTDAKTDIRFVICDGYWTFMDPACGALEYVPEKAPQLGVAGNYAHLRSADGEKLYTLKGEITTVEEVTIPALENLNLELTVKGRKEGTTTALADGTKVVLVPETGESVEATISGGKIAVELQNTTYTVTAGEYVGTLLVDHSAPPTELLLGYKYATSTGTDGYGSIDFSMMNELNHTLTLDGCDQATGTAQRVEAKLNLPVSVADSKYAIAETTVKFNGSVGFWSHRFGTQMTANKGVGVSVLPSDAEEPRLQVFELYAENASDCFAGWGNAYTQHYNTVVAALNGSGLRLRLVRSDTKIFQYAYLNGAWVQFGDPVACDTNAKTDIRFLVCDGSWTFSNIGYGKLEYVPEKAAEIGVSGNHAYLRSADGKLYTLDGVETTEADVTIPALEDVTLNLTVKGRKDGNTTVLADGTKVILTPETGEKVEAAVTDGKIAVKLQNTTYMVTAGEYEGTLSVDHANPPAELLLGYKYAASTGTADYGNADLSKMNEANHALTLDGCGQANSTSRYVEARLNLPSSVADSKYAIAETTVKFTGEVGFWSHRFGIKMTADNGVGATVLPADAWPALQVFGLYEENASDAFAGWNDNSEQYAAVKTALGNGGLKLRMVRSDTKIIPYAYLNGAWVQLRAPVTCSTDAKTDIRFLVCDGSWTFSDTGFGKLEYVPEKAAQIGVNGNHAYLRSADGKLYTLDGVETTEADVTIPALADWAYGLELPVTYRKDGISTALADGTVIELVPETGEKVDATVKDGKITVDLSYSTYTVTVGEYVGTLSVVKGSLPTELTLEYQYAFSTGTAGYGNADLTKMNDANHPLTLDGRGEAAGTDRYVEAKLNLPGAVADSKYAIAETTLKFNGNVGFWSNRFGIKMTADKGVGATVLPSDAGDPRLQVFELNKEANIFDGWSNTYTQYYDAVAAALNGSGLKLRLVRSDAQIYQYAYLSGAWVQLGDPVPCDTNAKTDIRFLICDGSWTFSNTAFGALEYVPAKEAQVGVNGNLAYLRAEDGKLYTPEGVETTEDAVTIASGITLNGGGTKESDSQYEEAKLDLTSEVADSKYAVVETTLRFNGGAEDRPWWYRFGIKMTENDGVGVMYFNNNIRAFELYGNPDAIFADAVGNDYPQYYSAVNNALTGTGLKLRAVRSDTKIVLYAYLNSAWIKFEPVVTCDADAKTDIRFLICDGSWTFSNTDFGALEYVPAKDPQPGLTGNVAHLRSEDGKLYTLDGAETTESDVTIDALEGVFLDIPVKGKKDGNTTALVDGTVVALTPEGGENVEVTVASGKIQVGLPYGSYTVTAGNYNGTLSVAKEETPPAELTLEYQYAFSTGTAGYGNADLTKMNDANHPLTLDGRGEAAGTDRYVEAKLNLPGAVADSKYAIAETTLKFNGSVGFWSHRFGIKMTADKGVGATVVPSDWGEPRLQVFELNKEANIFDGWSNTYTQYYDAVAAALNGSGLKLRLVRSDAQIYQYAYLSGAWVQLGDPVPCDTNAKTDIRFLICDGSWTFSNTAFGALEYVSAKEPQGDVDGNLAYLRAEDGKLYTPEGVETTEDDVTIASGITLNGEGTKTSDAQYEEVKLALPDTIANSKYAVVETRVKFNGGAEDRPWWYRFGIKMTENDGVGVLNFGDTLNAFELYGNPDAVFGNAVGIDYPQYKAQVDAALNGSGLKLRVVRSDTQITQYAFLNGAWVEFGPTVTCDTEARTDIRFLVCDGSWTFSKTVFDTTEPLAAAAAFVDMASGLELTVTGTKDGNAAALADGTVVVLTSEFGEKVEATVASGKIKVDLSYGTYQAAAGDYEGTLTVVKDALPTELKLTYIGSENVELELTVTGTKDGNAAALADGTVVVLTSESGEKVEATVASGKIKVDLSYGTYQAAAGDYEGTLAVVKDALPTELQLTFTGAEGDPKDPEPPATGTGDGAPTASDDETEDGAGNSEPPATGTGDGAVTASDDETEGGAGNSEPPATGTGDGTTTTPADETEGGTGNSEPPVTD